MATFWLLRSSPALAAKETRGKKTRRGFRRIHAEAVAFSAARSIVFSISFGELHNTIWFTKYMSASHLTGHCSRDWVESVNGGKLRNVCEVGFLNVKLKVNNVLAVFSAC